MRFPGYFLLLFILFGFNLQAQVCSDPSLLFEDMDLLRSQLDTTGKPVTRIDNILIPVKVVKVKDGDTAEILYEGLFLDVRFEHIDAPEIKGGQPFSQASRRHLLHLIEGKTVWLLTARKPNGGFGRLLGTFYTEEGLNVNKDMLANGMAWHYTEYSKDKSYKAIERCAQENEIGLWKDKKTIAPWKWRKGKR